MTDFSLTAYDSTGQQLRGGNHPMNYAFGRLGVTLPDSLKGKPVVIELYPAFARLPGHSWKGSARIRFLGLDEPVGEAGDLSVVAGGRDVVPLPNPPAIEKPEGCVALIRTRVTTLVGTVAVRRMAVGSGADGGPTR